MMGVGTLLVVCVDSHGGLINLTPGGKKRQKKADGGFVAKGCGAIMSDRKKKTRMV